MLTERDYEILAAGFPTDEIGEKDGKPYPKRSAIMKRLRLVDPGYVPDVDTIVQQVGDTVTVWGSLTLKGVTHRASASVAVNAWRVEDPKAPKKTYVRVGDYEYARELANAQKKAATALLFRCAETFGVGLYIKEKTAGVPLSAVLAKHAHWALNGGGERISTKMKALSLEWPLIKTQIEPGKTLERLSDTTLSEDQVSIRLDEIADGRKVQSHDERL